MGLDHDALDRYITGGRYSRENGHVTCRECGEDTIVLAETEYGATTWDPDECKHCGTQWTGLEEFGGDPAEDAAIERAEARRDEERDWDYE